MEITILPILKDNYAYVLQTTDDKVAVIDPGEAPPVIEYLEKQSLKLTHIINTHHHGDHTAGNQELKDTYGALLAAPKGEEGRIDGIDIPLSENTPFQLGEETLQILETPGHTDGGICLYAPESKALFTGDTLFLSGCGRLFEGTHEQMWRSMQKIKALPNETRIYCGHEYTLSNAEFAAACLPDNQALKARLDEVRIMRESGKTTLPGLLKIEKEVNLFLNAKDPNAFKAIRSAKDMA